MCAVCELIKQPGIMGLQAISKMNLGPCEYKVAVLCPLLLLLQETMQ